MKVKTTTSPDDKQKKRGGIQPRNRTKYSASQLHALETLFLVSQYPDSTTVEELGTSLGVSIERISIWFQNRRSKFKRQSKDVHMAWMRKQIFNQDSHQTPVGMPVVPPSQSSQAENRHVLSPPEEAPKKENVNEKPRSNLHYMPMTSASYDPAHNYSALGYNPSQTTFNHSSSPSTSTTTSYSSSTTNPLLMSHLLNDMSSSSMVPPAYQSCNYGNSAYNMYTGYPYYQQMNPYYSMNSQQQMYSS
ncbi:hypothetical protein SNE40_014563 [Patella caerulea]|uniref:Homeobox domain-containing protein n=1 Tax=Patella caerulea TaxID=87958 RepID=A0AAN8JFX2_PATCE